MGFLLVALLAGIAFVAGSGSKSNSDPPMPGPVADNFNALMTNPSVSPQMLEAAAVSYDAGGFHNAAAKLRARAAQLRAAQGPGGGSPPFSTPTGPVGPGSPPFGPGTPPLPGTPPPPVVTPGGDPSLPPDLQAMANQLLASNDPADAVKLDAAAVGLDAAGFHTMAAAMRARAAVLRAAPPGQTPPAPPPPIVPTAAVYVIKSGDNPSAIARKFTGDASRWRELLDSNPGLKVVQSTTSDGSPITLVQPFNPGQTLKLPASWPATPQS